MWVAFAYVHHFNPIQLRKWLNLHLQFGKHADAAKAAIEKSGILRLRLFIDGRRDVAKSNVVLATIKIEGHRGSDVEITVGIVETCEDRRKYHLKLTSRAPPALSYTACVSSSGLRLENLLHHFKDLATAFIGLEGTGLEVMGVSVPVHAVTVLDGKCYELAFGKPPANDNHLLAMSLCRVP